MPSYEDKQKAVDKLLNKNVSALEAAVIEEYRQTLNSVRAEMVKLYERYEVGGKLTLGEMSRYNRLQSMEKRIIGILGPSFKKTKRAINRLSEVHYNQSFFRSAWVLENDQRLDLSWGLPSDIPEAKAFKNIADEFRLGSLAELPQESAKRVMQTIRGGILEGATIGKMSKQIKDAMNINANQALRIIRTEMHRLQEIGKYAQFIKANDLGIDTRRRLIAVIDSVTRQQSASMDGQFSDEKGLFTYPGGIKSFPGSTGVARWDINDRETTIQVIDGLSPPLRRIRDEGVVPFKTFNEWAKGKGLKKNISDLTNKEYRTFIRGLK